MENWRKEFIEELKVKRTSYADMIDFCCDSMVCNFDIMYNLIDKCFEFDIYCGNDYDEETEEYKDFYQYFIITSNDAERIADYTNEVVYCCEELDLYILGVTHYGTPWSSVPANWKSNEED